MNPYVLTALSAYFLWGLFPVFWKLMAHLSAPEILSHRILWAFVVFMLIFWVRFGNFKMFLCLKKKDHFKLMLAGLFLSINWLTYIYAVNTGHVLEGSLAYFITPLLNVAAGTLVFKEKQSVFTLVAFLMCVLAVGIMAVMQHQVPYLSLVMALTFSTYGLIKKMIQIDPILSVNVESFYMLPVALLAAVYLRTTSDYVTTSADWSYFVLGGVVTALPIWWFSTAVQKIPLIQMGFMQFVSPTIQFLLAILLYQESFPNPKKWAFLIIWTAIAVYILGLYYQQRKLKLQRVSPEAAPSL